MRKLTLILFFLVTLTGVCYSYTYDNDNIRRLTKVDGLIGLSVFDIVEDDFGEIWIATSCGINHYNGAVVRSFRLPTDVPNPLVYRLAFSPNHGVYAATKAGIYSLTPKSDGFVRIMDDIAAADAICVVGKSVFVGNSHGLHILKGRSRKDIYLAGDPQHRKSDILVSTNAGLSIYYTHNEMEAEDFIQDTIIKLMRLDVIAANTERYVLFTIAHRLVIDDARHKYYVHRAGKYMRESIDNLDNSMVNNLERAMIIDMTDCFVETMPKKRGEIYKCVYKKFMSTHEIAEDMHLSPRTVETHLYLATKQVKSYLKKVM